MLGKYSTGILVSLLPEKALKTSIAINMFPPSPWQQFSSHFFFVCIKLHSALGTCITELTYCYYDTSDCQVRLILIITVQKTSQEVTEACSITEIAIA